MIQQPTYRRPFWYCSLALASFIILFILSWKLNEQMEVLSNSWQATEENLLQQPLVVNDISDREFYEKKWAVARERARMHSTVLASNRNRSKLPLILDWTTFWGHPMKELVANIMSFCPVQCNFSSEKSLVDKADAVVFHIHDIDFSNLPSVRHSFQRYVFWTVESLETYRALGKLTNNFFNWTFTHRLDSDFANNYGDFVIPNSTVVGEKVVNYEWNYVKNIAAKKTKMVTQFVSNCRTPSKREDYVAELAKYVNVDVFGRCGKKGCKNREECSATLSNDYRFYLAFENSVCLEYVTEKFWRLKDLIVPVVLRGSDYKNIAPKGSFIAADDFSSPQELATFLIQLANNETEYLKYFEWTKHYGWLADGGGRPFCEMCTALHNDSMPSKIYESMENWWWKENNCQFNYAWGLIHSKE